MGDMIKIGTRASQLAMWQANQVATFLQQQGHKSTIIQIHSEGDLDLTTPLYEMGVEGVFTRYLDAALLTGKVDIAVHSMKDVPVVMAKGLTQAAVLKRGPVKDVLIYKNSKIFLNHPEATCTIATGSVRRKAQWLHYFPNSRMTGLRGNVNTRLRKLKENDWDGALFAAAGLERIHLRPKNSIDIDWMLPAPAQGAILIACKADDDRMIKICDSLNDTDTALCTKIERDFLQTLLGGCSTPISALAEMKDNHIYFKGNILTPDGERKVEIEKSASLQSAEHLGVIAGKEVLDKGAKEIVELLTK